MQPRTTVICVAFGAGLMLFQSCTVGPDYVAPEVKPPDAWASAVADTGEG